MNDTNSITKPSVSKSPFHLDENLPHKFSSEWYQLKPSSLLRLVSLGYIDQNQEELADNAEMELDKVASDLNLSLDNIMNKMENKMIFIERKEQNLFKPVAEEQLQITSTSASGEKTDILESLGDRMTEFEEIVNRHAKALDKLWAEWQVIQDEIITLWVKELGPDAIPVNNNSIPNALKDVVEAGTISWRQAEVVNQDMKKEVQSLQKNIEECTSGAMKTAKEQEKVRIEMISCIRFLTCMARQVWNTAFQRKLQNILDNLRMIS